ncbi:MAG: tetratricopeptide repeat protein, partial [Gemmataceae bacterium]|nr:tetratricopeptide repeat protein [Gemmataceae bacterium]
VYFGGVVPNAEKGTVQAPPKGETPDKGGTNPPPAQPALDPQAAFAAGDTAKAVEHFKAKPPTSTPEKAVAGRIGVFARVQALKDGEPLGADDADLTAARANLKAVIDDVPSLTEPGGVKRAVEAAVALGVSYEVAGDPAKAREVYTDAKAKYPAYASTFDAHLDRLSAAAGPGGTSRRLHPADAERLLAAVVFLVQDEPANKPEDPEPGVFFWKAVKLANAGAYAEAVKELEKAKEAHQKRAKAVAGRGLNPLSDPLEQIFTRSCDELKAAWELKAGLYGSPAIAAAIKKDGLAKALEGFTKAADSLVTAQKETATARELVKKLEGDVAKLDKDAKASEKSAMAADKDAKEATKAKLEAEKKLDVALGELKTAATDLKAAEKKLDTAMTDLKSASEALKVAEKESKDQRELLASLAETLKPASQLPEKWTGADVVAATKSVVARATGPDLKVLAPSGVMAIGGGGLAVGQLLDLADRLTKAEAAAKDATTKLATETKRLNDKYDTDIKKLKDAQAGELKTLADKYAADAKKLNESHVLEVKKLTDGSAAELKKFADKYALEIKKLTDDYTAATAKLKESHESTLKEEQAKLTVEKQRSAAREVEFQKQLAGAVTQGQVMEIWLPVLTELRRSSDAAPALAAAEKAIKGSAPGSEDDAKARAVAGMAYFIQGDLVRAKDMFQTAKQSAAYKAGAVKPWVAAIDNGLEALTDPLAPYRQPVVVPPVDVKAAAKSLDAGISSYKAGRYDVAVAALRDATRNDPSDPVSWYFLGAAEWALGKEEDALKDFAQGAEREKNATTSGRALSGALAPIQGAARDALDRKRP